jgi:hypothetical protein
MGGSTNTPNYVKVYRNVEEPGHERLELGVR